MTKKLFYSLATFVMSLLLVVGASACKSNTRPENNPTQETTQPNPGGESDITIDINDSQWNSKMVVENYLIANDAADTTYYRFPVVVAIPGDNGKSSVAIFYEERYGENGTPQDVGVNGQNKVNLKYTLGYDNNGTAQWHKTGELVGSADATSDATKSKGAPYVFVDDNRKVHVFATSGGGLYATVNSVDSKIGYISGDVSADGISWNNSGWTEITPTGLPSDNNKDKNFATWSGSGKKIGDKYYLPIVYTTTPTGGGTWGVALVDVTGFNFTTTTTATLDVGTGYAESKVLATGGSTASLAIRFGNGGKLGYATLSGTSLTKGSDINIADGGWGSIFESFYDTSSAATYFINAQKNNTTMSVSKFSGDIAGGSSPTKSLLLNTDGKAGSIAVLADGTIFTVAEEGKRTLGNKDNDTASRNFDVVYRRFTPSYFDNNTQAKALVRQ